MVHKKDNNKNSQTLKAVLSCVSEGICILNSELQITGWNEGARAISAYTKEEIEGKDYSVFFTNNPIKNCDFTKHVKSHSEWERTHKNGHIVVCHETYAPVRDENGQISGYIIYFKDITQNKWHEYQATILSNIFEIDRLGIIIKDEEGRIIDWSAGAQKILGYSKEQILGKTSKFYSRPEDYADIEVIDESLKKGMKVSRPENSRIHKDGHIVVTSTMYTPSFSGERLIGSIATFYDMTEEKAFVHRQQHLVSTLNELFEKLSSAFCLYELIEVDGVEDLQIVIANQAYSDWINIPREELIGRRFTDICPDDMEFFAGYMSVIKDGESRCFEAYSFFFKKDINGVVYSPGENKVAIVMTDRTRLVEVERKLREKEDDIALLFSSMTTGFCLGRVIRDINGNPIDIYFEMANKAFEEMEDYRHGFLQGKMMSEVTNYKFDPYAHIYMDVATNKNKRLFRKYVASRESTLDAVCYSPSDDHFVCIENDISERVKAETELRKAYRDTEAILHEIPAPICVVNKESGLVLDCNAAFTKMCNANDKVYLIKSPFDRFFKTVNNSPGFSAVSFLHKGRNFNCMLETFDEGSVEIEVFSRSFIYRDSEAFAVYCLDLTEQKEHERVLKDAAEEAERASKMKTNFLANMSHEIRTPMNGVIGFTELALDSGDIPEDLRVYLESIKTSAAGLLDLINDVLDIAKIEAGRMELETAPFDIGSLLLLCESINAPKAEEKGIRLSISKCEFPGKMLIGDQNKLRQILLNLLSNSIKFTETGMVEVSAVITPQNGGKASVLFEIIDSGIGMSLDQLKIITEPFMQVDSGITRKYGGAGLGLSIANSLIELMGGKLEIDSTKGVGSAFSFELTFDVTEQTEVISPATIDSSGKLKPMFDASVLVCEDNFINQQVITEHLGRIGITPEIADNGKIGVDIVKERLSNNSEFDLVLMDIHMPVMDGLEASRLISSISKVPIVAMTANVMTIDLEKYYKEGISDCLSKPFKPHEFWNCLLKYLKPVGFRAVETRTPQLEPRDGKTVINTALGLERAAGNEKLYNGILRDFLKSNINIVNEIEETLRKNDIKTAHRLAHTLKGTAATIGAEKLSKTAYEVEHALADGATECSPVLLHKLKQDLMPVIEEIEAIKDEHVPDVSENLSTEAVTAERIKRLAELLLVLLEHGNAESLEYIDEIKWVFAKFEECDILIEQIEDFEYEAAFNTLKHIKSKMEND